MSSGPLKFSMTEGEMKEFLSTLRREKNEVRPMRLTRKDRIRAWREEGLHEKADSLWLQNDKDIDGGW